MRFTLAGALLVAALPSPFIRTGGPVPVDSVGRAQTAPVLPGPAARERRDLLRAFVAEKLHRALPEALRAGDVDFWVVIDRENHPDPLHEDLGAAYSGAGAAFVFCDRGGGRVERLFIGSAQPIGSAVDSTYDVKDYTCPTLQRVLQRVREIVDERQPKRIAVNRSAAQPVADGLTAALEEALIAALGPDHARRVVTAEHVVHAFRATRTPLETKWYTSLQQWTAAWQTEALSRVEPGVTSVLDLACHAADRAVALGLPQAGDHGRFPLIVWLGDRGSMAGVRGFGDDRPSRSPETDGRDFVVQPGDILTLDGGLRFMGFASDMKRSAYVLRPGETEWPESLREAWRLTLAMAARYARRMVPGAYGDQVWRALETDAADLGLRLAGAASRPPADAQVASIYGHAVGNVVHDIGARVTPPPAPASAAPTGLPLCRGEWVSIEFHLVVPARDAPRGAWYVRFEQVAQVDDPGARWLTPLQEVPILIRANREEDRLPPSHRILYWESAFPFAGLGTQIRPLGENNWHGRSRGHATARTPAVEAWSRGASYGEEVGRQSGVPQSSRHARADSLRSIDDPGPPRD